MEKLLLGKDDVIIVKRANQKAYFAAADTLLIDDRQDNIQNFVSRGGHGFLFRIWDNESCNAVLNLIKDIDNGKSTFNN